MSKYYYNKDYFEKINSPDKSYWLGFLYADGCINRYYIGEKLKSMTLELTVCKEDKHHLDKFVSCLETNIPIKEKFVTLQDKKYSAFRIQLNCTKLCYDLIDKGCTPQKTYIIQFPNNNQVPHEFMRDFLRGYFDGDGCIHTSIQNNAPHIETCITGMKNMLKQISEYLIDEQVIRKIPKIQQDPRSKACDIYIYGKDNNKEFLDYLYLDSDIFLDRKYQKYLDFYKDYQEIEKHGVHWHEGNKAYVVTIRINGKHIRVGQRKTLEEAIELRKQAELDKLKIALSDSNI